MQTSNFAVRLPRSLHAQLKEAAAEGGVAMNQYLVVALAEKLATRRSAQSFLAERAARSSLPKALEILERAGTDVEEHSPL
ncbi:toxin-antitoxin system HicB family antitoxin [Desulfonatronum thioautotrophicum]|uniref:toxin-antitoxin system HicB family antitoxin n=1 Tax=Desulfonatronum thioautotrophicum TaxID=617001 RepID=UPI0005EAF3C6|nr:toxin-antitoxin system HicB family antitoxin [Desulfonatronum thioautotrophicum]